MTKIINYLTRWLVYGLNRMVFWLEGKDSSVDKQSKFVDLAPTNDADKDGVYSEALLFATNNVKVANIALTGPYGSGKSSIIQSFMKKYRRPALHISLAAFVSEGDIENQNVKASHQEIERSILQQMLYGAKSNKLPLSRFKRIQSPSFFSIFKSLYLMLGVLTLWYVFHRREEIISGTFFDPIALSNWFNFGTLTFSVVFLWVVIHHFYVASFGLSLKGISLKDVEIKSAQDDEVSILNRHLDEIVYFFQSTRYDLVIIEDLDRFNNPEIFVILREINSLVNENAGVKRTIRFLYALRDDIFINTERTKFFEFIIPVIPIINTSNSIDMVLKQRKRLKLDERLDHQFLREVSRYLNDLRLIQNIFNEYTIYTANLETDGESILNANKLLSILIYKNVYPRDFEQLHRGEGTLFEILNRKAEFIEHGEAIYRVELTELENQLEFAEKQTPSDVKELRRIYAMALVEKIPANISHVQIGGGWINFAQLVDHNAFDELIEASHVMLLHVHGSNQQVNISKLQDEVDPHKSYQQRKAEIEYKVSDNKSKILRNIHDLKSKISELRMVRFNELLRLNVDHVKDLFEDLGGNEELARFLLLEGYLDDTYYQYTSLFHSGRLSPNDNKFLIQIRAFVTPDPIFAIDNPKEIIAAMRDEDFCQSYVLNVNLIDYLLNDSIRYQSQTKKFFEYISSDFENCEEFFDAYYAIGLNVVRLLSELTRVWKDFVPTAIASPNNISHVSQLLLNLPKSVLKNIAKNFEELSEGVSDNLLEILSNVPELAPERLKYLDFEIRDFAAIKEHSRIVHFMFEAGHFELTINNLEYVYQEILGENNLSLMREENFTTIRSINSSILMNRIERDFELYFNDVLFKLEGNTKEDASALLAIIRNDTLDQDYLREFLERQTELLPTLEGVPERLHSMLFQLGKIEPTWLSCLAFMESEGFDADVLTDYLDQDIVRIAILKYPIPSTEDSKKLRFFIFKSDSLSDVSYKEYIHALPNPFKVFPENLGLIKLRSLIDRKKIVFTKDCFDQLSEKRDLQLRFVVANIGDYLADSDSFDLDDDFLEVLLGSEINHADKLKIVCMLDLDTFVDLPERSKIIGSIISDVDIEIPNLNGNVVQSLVVHSAPIANQISLFNKYINLLTDEEIRHVLAELPKPFSEIKTGRKTPRLKNTPENQRLVKWLDERNIISSVGEGGIMTDDIKLNLYRK